MVEYKCNRCNQIFSKKSIYINHLKRKNPCKKTSIKNPPINPPKPDRIVKKEYRCSFCDLIFTRSDSLKKHTENRCKKKKEDITNSENQLILKEILVEMKLIREENYELKHENKDLKSKAVELEKKLLLIENNKMGDVINYHNIITDASVNTQNIINNYNIVAFGKEELEKTVPESVCKKIFLKGFEAVPSLVEYVHFNEKNPECQNCYISNMRDKYAIIYDGEKWNLRDASEVINTLRDDKQTFLENKFEAFYDSLDEITCKKFGKFLAEKDSDAVAERYKQSLRLLLYNNRGIVITSKKKLEESRKIIQVTNNKISEYN